MADTTALVPVQFHGATLTASIINGKPHVAVRPICDALGIDADSQLKRIKRHPVLNKGSVITAAPSVGGEQLTVMLALDKLNGWLFGVSVSRVKPELRERLTQYQAECFDVLAQHFGTTRPANPALDYDRISPAQAQSLKELVQAVVEAGAQGFGETWARLHRKFRVNSYLELPASQFDEACAYLRSKLPTGGLSLSALISAGNGVYIDTPELLRISQACIEKLASRAAFNANRKGQA